MDSVHFIFHLLMGVALTVLVSQNWLLRQKLSSDCINQLDQRATDDVQHDSSTGNKLLASDLMEDYNKSHAASSVWCLGREHTDRICHFHNLYYLPDEDQFGFLHGESSIYIGLPLNRFDPALLDMSSVKDHNVHYFNYMDILSMKADSLIKSAHVISQRSLIFSRFHPGNLMHVIHDDLLPIYHTFVAVMGSLVTGKPMFSTEPFDIQLVLMDGLSMGPFQDIYELFSSYAVLSKQDLHTLKRPVVFADAIVGVSKHTTWYQYGFNEAQGPLSDHNVSAWDIRQFSKFLKRRLNITEDKMDDAFNGEKIVLLTRKSNRLILNEFNLTLALAQALQMKVVTMAMETHSLADMIKVVSSATILIGMHGSLLSLSLFLPAGSMLVELFPYAVNPEHYTPYKTLASLPGMQIKYVAWRNLDVKKSVAHADRSIELGGIMHLSEEEQNRILNSKEVPRHFCCQEAEWLFRIYQDTTVDTNAIIDLIKFHLTDNVTLSTTYEESVATSEIFTNRIFPSHVRSIKCAAGTIDPVSIYISWKPPVNLDFVRYQSVRYEVWVQEHGVDDYTAWIISKTSHHFSAANIRPETKYNIWIRCLMDNVIGPFNLRNVTCSM